MSKSKKIKLVTEAEGFFYGTFSDCKICDERYYEEREQIRTYEIEKARERLCSYLQDLIDELDNGADPDDIESELINDWHREEDEDYNPGIPSRYQ